MGAIYYKICIDSYEIYLLECFTSPLRKYVSRENSENKRMNDDVVQGLQLVSEDQDSQLGGEDVLLCPLEATESW